ncbi:hypothetical protein F5B22DRAFT_612263 [Xylaria bambusicola]|uniref:uncharacterized protein n=1 Tax=Xylaria bambusicola TaxID=326684 RepID=UPI0020081DB8|nr:uncharacterized protein F5B22DRAFT_612263 [Xylaria bambusicola]KAI0513101.1 hypothetical protein F5B22DRAFT_612263 [Xylaria bambusicola]
MDDDSDSPPPRPRPTRDLPSRRAKMKTPARETRATAAYFTASSTTQTSASSTETDARIPTRNLRPLRTKRKSSTTVAMESPAKKVKGSRAKPSPTKRPHIPLPLPLPQSLSSGDVDDPCPNHSPHWHHLPYHVWLCVFNYVATPCRNPTSRIDDLAEAVDTLLSGARTCRSTTEPALAALYKCPPFHRVYSKSPQTSFVQFLQTLALDPSNTLIRYRPKVEILRINVDATLTKKINGQQLQLKQVLKHLPRLACLELHHPADDPPYRDLDINLRWRFSKADLLDGLDPGSEGESSDGSKTTVAALKSWRWNSRLAPTDLALDCLPKIHALSIFQSLRKVAFVNYQLPSTTRFAVRARQSQEAQDSDRQAIAHLAASISALPELQHLVIESSTLANGTLLELLPNTLSHLELVNCWEITSEGMSAYLASHGNSLEQLTLKYCQSLSLGFLPVLGTSCPNLKHLEVDLSYFRHHESYADNKPEYATLLAVDDVPTWPSSIQSIEIINMRNWSREAAEMFFNSLIRNAKSLPDLRRLEFKVILNIEWRQRQEMRRSLANKMTKVFKRKSSPPKELKSSRQFPALRHLKTANQLQTPKAGKRQSARLADQPSPLSLNKLSLNNKGNAYTPGRSGRRLRPLKSNPIFDADDEDSSEDELSLGHTGPPPRRGRTATAKEAGLRGDAFIHGLCDVVDIQVDNQRPAERQYNEDDFLDSPEQSDPEWNSADDDVFT